MARFAREKSDTGIYHVMLRGIDRRNIFLDHDDRTIFLEKMIRAKETVDFKLYAYCLMDNHVHLLIKESEEIGVSIKRFTVAYVHFHNDKYERTGHLFQNRFKSEPVETESYLINVARYIHQNPVKANIINQVSDYLWSSYHQYQRAYQEQSTFIDTDLVMSYLSKFNDFKAFMIAENDDEFLDDNPVHKITDLALRQVLKSNFNFGNLDELPQKERNLLIKEAYQYTGASIRQLGRVLGIGKTIIEKAVREDK